MVMQKLFEQVVEHFDEILKQKDPLAYEIWLDFLKVHPADMGAFLSDIPHEKAKKLFLKLPQHIKLAVFEELSYQLKIVCLSAIDHTDRQYLLSHLSIDVLTDFFDELSDEELKEYLKLLTKKDRERVLSLRKFDPESAGGIMDTEVLSLRQDFTVEKSIQIMQRLQPSRELYRQIFVTDYEQRLVGYILLEDLVLQQPKTRLETFMRKSEMIALAEEDREEVVKRMVHYGLTIVPVTTKEGLFLGVISGDTLAEVLEEEASEDIYRMSALTPFKHTYLETPFVRLLYQRGSILLILLLIQTISSFILHKYQFLLSSLIVYLTMLVSAGGNASSQSSALMIQGLATGELHEFNIGKFMKREFFMALALSGILGIFQFVRLYAVQRALKPLEVTDFFANIAVSLSLSLIIFVAIMFGSLMPWFLKRFNVDPAHSAGPLLATLMDVVGLLIFCFISQLVLGS